MNKKLFGFFSIFIALFMGALYYSTTIQTPISSSLNTIKTTYYDTIKFVEDGINKHFFQAKKIAQLEEDLEKYEKNHLVMRQLASEIQDLFNESNSSFKVNTEIDLVRAISYSKFGDFNKIWLEVNDYNSSKIYGLLYKELVAGIVVAKNDKPLALLNKDIKSTYAVYIGEQKAPGIAHGNNSENIIIKFIPTWFKISVGDEVLTSGLDKIFFKGLKVGKVISVTSSEGYQNAIVDPYYKSNDLNYFHLIRTIK
jgi:rod shape-determining protein MreC